MLLPSVSLALVLELGPHRELMPVCNRGLLVDAAVAALRDAIEDAYAERNPAAAEAKVEEVVVLSRVLRKLIPEMRDLLQARTPAPGTEALVQ